MVGPEITRRMPYIESLRITSLQFLTAGLLGAFSVGLNPLFLRRPLTQGMWRHGLAVVVGFYGGTKLDQFLDWTRNRTVASIEDYMAKHPEDFPPEVPRKYKDVLLPWSPVR
ncbi:NADH dehydrogenase [ubiquinone] 1 subunit C2-like [Physella acuta]|uniref:NADH dehydrogenase [ubiquinone] 1 subunit C2-like n=1 Tax=Physella acuta TaxID=109671 RepID=UPI0027DCDDB1|nr:NADH dehydrogenase [ubiquinone] 1 subunit C2-like [Physella acuta]